MVLDKVEAGQTSDLFIRSQQLRILLRQNQ
jgi:hypothetical protein